ncbi:MAG: response regulator transcription factor [Sphaerochaetaceae bacterium]|nr:response regulator transcription factor [Sphaerochaetaceae bacterium]
MHKEIRICIAEDNKALRKYFNDIFTHEPDITVVGTARSGREIVKVVEECDCDVILMDVEMEERQDGIDAVRTIHSRNPKIKNIMLTIHEDIDTIMDAFEAGAVDFIIKNSSASIIIKAIRDANENKSSLEPVVSEKLRNNILLVKKKKNNINKIIQILSSITKTERTILNCIMDNLSLREMAEVNFIELPTVKYHIGNILKKFEVTRRKDIVHLIKDMGIEDLLRDLSDKVE